AGQLGGERDQADAERERGPVLLGGGGPGEEREERGQDREEERLAAGEDVAARLLPAAVAIGRGAVERRDDAGPALVRDHGLPAPVVRERRIQGPPAVFDEPGGGAPRPPPRRAAPPGVSASDGGTSSRAAAAQPRPKRLSSAGTVTRRSRTQTTAYLSSSATTMKAGKMRSSALQVSAKPPRPGRPRLTRQIPAM